MNFPKITLHIFICDSVNYMEKLSSNSWEISFQLHKIIVLSVIFVMLSSWSVSCDMKVSRLGLRWSGSLSQRRKKRRRRRTGRRKASRRTREAISSTDRIIEWAPQHNAKSRDVRILFPVLYWFLDKIQKQNPKHQGVFTLAESLKAREKKRETLKKSRKFQKIKKTRKSRNVSRVMFRKRELAEFCAKLGEFRKKLGEFVLTHK